MLLPSLQQPAQAVGPAYEETYVVIQPCNAGPCLPSPYDEVGWWFLACDGSFTGNGWLPGTYSTYTVVTQGEACEHEPPVY